MMKNTQSGKVNKVNTVVLVLIAVAVALVVMVGGVLAASYVSAFNFGNEAEKNLSAAQQDAKNVLAQYGQRVQEQAQVNKAYADDLTKLATATMEGRYGDKGSAALMQWITEQNPQLSETTYVKLQQTIEAGRNDFAAAQRRQIDLRRQYETALGSFWQGMWLRVAGYPKIKLSDFDIVSTDRANQAYATKVEDPIKLR